MCGISGFIDFNKESTLNELERMTDVLHHRGPDDSGYSFYNENKYNVGLGHRRLSILDLSKHGHQPMSFEQLEIVYNGEVYNFKEIRTELEEFNYKFDSDSDTEVILKAYHKWGLKFVDKLNGMFALIIYDKTIEKVYVFRDRAGVKPLYWYWDSSLFLYSSELKSFHENQNFKKEINIDALGLFLQYGYILQPHTIFKNTYKLKSGHYLEIDLKEKRIKEIKYWDVIDFYNKPKLQLSDIEAIEKTEDLLVSSFNYRMVSDVPVGVFLSGGYDSSVVTALLQKNSMDKIKTFTIGFHEKGYDEAPFAKQVAKYLDTDHTEYYCTQKEALEVIPKLVDIYDEPFGDASSIPTTLVSQIAKKDVTVALSADGGDEIFGGYSKYTRTLNYYNKYKNIPLSIRKIIFKVLESISPNHIPFNEKIGNFESKYEKVKSLLATNEITEYMNYLSQPFMSKEINKFLLTNYRNQTTNFGKFENLDSSLDSLSKMLCIDYQTYMVDDILTKVDRATMSVSLEGREPLLDYKIIEFVAQLDSNLKIRNGNKKWLLKEITHNYIPKTMMDRPKMGFAVPLMEWFRDELKEYFLEYLNEERLNREKIFNTKEVIILRDSYLKGNNENVEKLWYILLFEMWYEKWM